MPIANLKNVFGVSSEDNTCPASNLLSSTNRKWKCESPAPSSIFVILQFEQPVKISGIDIGNEHSAFVEVFVGKNGWNPDKYQQILLSSSFMTPMESRNSTSTNRVRCFAQIALEPTVCAENWDLIKIACTQPFNKHVQYGLSFIKVHCVDAIKKESEMPAKKMKCESLLNLPAYNVFSQFKLRENTPESDEDTKGSSSLFLKWKQSKTTDPDANETIAKPTNVSAASAIRDATSSAQKLKKLTAVKSKNDVGYKRDSTAVKENTSESVETQILRHDRNRESLMYDDEDLNTSIPKLEKMIDKDNERIRLEQQDSKPKKKNDGKAASHVTSTSNRNRNDKKMEASAHRFKTFSDSDNETASKRNDNKNGNDNLMNTSTNGGPSTIAISSACSSIQNNANAKTPVRSSKRPLAANDSIEENKTKKRRSSISNTKQMHYKPFKKMLEDVVIAISGIQNPERADIRDKAQIMGAKYKPDWDISCTHLICAFKNTPKYNQVLGQGKIVKRNWITECFTQKKRLSWRRYALDSKETSLPDSEDEIHDLASKPLPNRSIGQMSLSHHANDDESANDDVLNMYELSVPKSPSIIDSGSDTENEIESSPTKQNVSQPNQNIPESKVPDIYDVSTDEDVPK